MACQSITSLPVDCFYCILQCLPPAEIARVRPIFPMFEVCFENLLVINLQQTTALGIERLVTANLARSTRQLCTFYNLQERWACTYPKVHTPQIRFSSTQHLTQLLKQFHLKLQANARQNSIQDTQLNIESLDLRGQQLTFSLIEAIDRYCPKICCLRLNYATFESVQAFNLFVRRLSHKIEHLSCDNNLFVDKSKGSYGQLFSSLSNLTQIEIVLFPTELLNANDFANFETRLDFMSLHFYRTKYRTLAFEPFEALSFLNDSKARNLLYLKIKSNYDYEKNYDLFVKAKNLSNLRGLTLLCKNFLYQRRNVNFRTQNCWPHLQCLTVDLYYRRGSNQLLKDILHGEYSRNLENLRIFDFKLQRKTLEKLSYKCQSLSVLQLIDITMKDFGSAFQIFSLFTNLKTLCVEFTATEIIDETPSSEDQLVALYRFPIDQIQTIVSFFQQSKTIKNVQLLDWPGLTREQLNHVFEIAEQRGICLVFREFKTFLTRYREHGFHFCVCADRANHSRAAECICNFCKGTAADVFHLQHCPNLAGDDLYQRYSKARAEWLPTRLCD